MEEGIYYFPSLPECPMDLVFIESFELLLLLLLFSSFYYESNVSPHTIG